MTPSELEAMVRNLNTRTTAIEQILQTLATRDARPLFEEVKSRIELLAEHLANVPTEIRELREKVAVIPELTDDIQRLTEQVSGLARKIDDPPRRRR